VREDMSKASFPRNLSIIVHESLSFQCKYWPVITINIDLIFVKDFQRMEDSLK